MPTFQDLNHQISRSQKFTPKNLEVLVPDKAMYKQVLKQRNLKY